MSASHVAAAARASTMVQATPMPVPSRQLSPRATVEPPRPHIRRMLAGMLQADPTLAQVTRAFPRLEMPPCPPTCGPMCLFSNLPPPPAAASSAAAFPFLPSPLPAAAFSSRFVPGSSSASAPHLSLPAVLAAAQHATAATAAQPSLFRHPSFAPPSSLLQFLPHTSTFATSSPMELSDPPALPPPPSLPQLPSIATAAPMDLSDSLPLLPPPQPSENDGRGAKRQGYIRELIARSPLSRFPPEYRASVLFPWLSSLPFAQLLALGQHFGYDGSYDVPLSETGKRSGSRKRAIESSRQCYLTMTDAQFHSLRPLAEPTKWILADLKAEAKAEQAKSTEAKKSKSDAKSTLPSLDSVKRVAQTSLDSIRDLCGEPIKAPTTPKSEVKHEGDVMMAEAAPEAAAAAASSSVPSIELASSARVHGHTGLYELSRFCMPSTLIAPAVCFQSSEQDGGRKKRKTASHKKQGKRKRRKASGPRQHGGDGPEDGQDDHAGKDPTPVTLRSVAYLLQCLHSFLSPDFDPQNSLPLMLRKWKKAEGQSPQRSGAATPASSSSTTSASPTPIPGDNASSYTRAGARAAAAASSPPASSSSASSSPAACVSAVTPTSSLVDIPTLCEHLLADRIHVPSSPAPTCDAFLLQLLHVNMLVDYDDTERLDQWIERHPPPNATLDTAARPSARHWVPSHTTTAVGGIPPSTSEPIGLHRPAPASSRAAGSKPTRNSARTRGSLQGQALQNPPSIPTPTGVSEYGSRGGAAGYRPVTRSSQPPPESSESVPTLSDQDRLFRALINSPVPHIGILAPGSGLAEPSMSRGSTSDLVSQSLTYHHTATHRAVSSLGDTDQ